MRGDLGSNPWSRWTGGLAARFPPGDGRPGDDGGMRRIVAPVVATGLMTLLLLPAAGWGAAPAPVQAGELVTAGDCPKPKPYPGAWDATVEVNTTAPNVGDPLEIAGIGYCPEEDVDLTIDGRRVGSAHTDSAGSFDPQFTTSPGPPGQKRVCGVVASGPAADSDCVLIHVQASGGSRAAPPARGGDTATTGVQIAVVGLLALGLVVGGVGVTTLSRNRRPDRD